MAATNRSPLLQLPVELRTQIFELVIGRFIITVKDVGFMLPRDPKMENYRDIQDSLEIERRWPVPDHPTGIWLELLRSCKEIYHGARLILYRSSVFVFHSFALSQMFLENLGPECAANIRNVAFDPPRECMHLFLQDPDAKSTVRALSGARSIVVVFRFSPWYRKYCERDNAVWWIRTLFEKLNAAQLWLGNLDAVIERVIEDTWLGGTFIHHLKDTCGRDFIELLASELTEIQHSEEKESLEPLAEKATIWVLSQGDHILRKRERELANRYYEGNRIYEGDLATFAARA